MNKTSASTAPNKLSEKDFHSEIHGSIGTPSKKYATVGYGVNQRHQEVPKDHKCEWAESSVDLKKRQISTVVYIDFQKNGLKPADYAKLKKLAEMGIGAYWSRKITVSNQSFVVLINVSYRKKKSIDVDLEINDEPQYARSHNSGLVDAVFIYNRGPFRANPGGADNDFKQVAAHEFGHSVLEYFGGKKLSWGHKGTTKPILQTVKSSTPAYPKTGEVDLMKYYDRTKNKSPIVNLRARTWADEIDVKRLVWMSKINFTK